jgi:sugar fermentation stimulation protein A|tara:strand:+ start:639 stop:1355 length:717 start_codon:yes stop_codon:yes gene_type:complete
MELPRPLHPGILIKRYKRFLADVVLEDGTELTAHCPNPGRMTGLMTPGTKIWLSRSDNPKRKLQFTFELFEGQNGLVGINTGHPNVIVSEAIIEGRISELAGYQTLRREVNYGSRSRIDVLLEDPLRGRCWVEIKNVHLKRDTEVIPGMAEFPDSVTTRGARHLYELANQVVKGDRAMMVYLVQRMDCDQFRIAEDIDPAYQKAFSHAVAVGVEVLCLDVCITTERIRVRRPIEVLQN